MEPTYIAGVHAVRHALQLHPDLALCLFLARDHRPLEVALILELAAALGLAVQEAQAATLDAWVPGVRHQGVVLRSRAAPSLGEADLEALVKNAAGTPLFLVLDGVEDPHNLGAALRVADAAGVTAIIIPKDRAAPLTPVVRKVASGAAEHVPLVVVTNLARSLEILQAQGVWVTGLADAAAVPFFSLDFRGATALVLGAEGSGLRRLTRERCDWLAFLPMVGVVESLNVSVTAGICLYEVVRQRGL